MQLLYQQLMTKKLRKPKKTFIEDTWLFCPKTMWHEITNASRTSKILDSSFVVGENMLLVIQNEKRHQEAWGMLYGFLTGSRAPCWAWAAKALLPRVWDRPQGGQEDAACFPSRAHTKECTQIYRGNSTERNLTGQLTQDGLVNPLHAGPVKMHDYGRKWGVLVCRHQTCGNMATRIFKAK